MPARAALKLASSLPATDSGAKGKMHMSVVRTLGARILGGEFNPGDAFPGEAVLALSLGVSRTIIREAVKVLAAMGHVDSCTRTGIRVRAHDGWRVFESNSPVPYT